LRHARIALNSSGDVLSVARRAVLANMAAVGGVTNHAVILVTIYIMDIWNLWSISVELKHLFDIRGNY
jgi:hypothetical protein